MSERPGIMLYFEIEPALKLLTDEQRGKLFGAIMEYGHYAAVPDFQQDELLKMAWNFIRPALDRDRAKYEERIEENREKGYRSAFKRYAVEHGIDPNDTAARERYVAERILMADQNKRQQRLSTADSCQPTKTTTSTPAPTKTITPSPDSTIATAGTGEGVQGENHDASSSATRFEDLKQARMSQLAAWSDVS